MKRVALALSATCLAVVAIGATRAVLSDSGGAQSAGRVPSAATLGPRLSRTVDGVRMSFRVPTRDAALLRRLATHGPCGATIGTGPDYCWIPGPIEAVPGASSAGPAGARWRSGSLYISKDVVGPQAAEAVVFWSSFPDGDHADPCAKVLSPSIGPSAADLAAAVATAPGTELVTGPSDVSVGGHPAKHVVLTVREDVGCDPGFFYTWQFEGWGPFWAGTNVGDTIRVWIIDVNGTRLFIEAETSGHKQGAAAYMSMPSPTPRQLSDLEQEIQQIVESIRFD